jgi:hypothetical protein
MNHITNCIPDHEKSSKDDNSSLCNSCGIKYAEIYQNEGNYCIVC